MAATALALFVVACSRPPDKLNDTDLAKMRLVVQEAIRQAPNEPEKAALRDGKVFLNVADLKLDQDVIGVSVPVEGGKHIHVAFMADHFRTTSVATLAAEVLKDFASARAENQH